MVEVCVGIVSACLPTLRPLVNEKPFESVRRIIQTRMSYSSSPIRSSRTSTSFQESGSRDTMSPALLVPMTELWSNSTNKTSIERLHLEDSEPQAEHHTISHHDVV